MAIRCLRLNERLARCADEHVVKPFNDDRLIDLITRMVG